jgi:hypothetical protein
MLGEERERGGGGVYKYWFMTLPTIKHWYPPPPPMLFVISCTVNMCVYPSGETRINVHIIDVLTLLYMVYGTGTTRHYANLINE